MTVIVFGGGAWSATRFVRSALWETAQAARTLFVHRRQVHQRAWLSTFDVAGARRELPTLAVLNPVSGWVPDFLVAPPSKASTGIEADLREVGRTPGDRVRADLRRSLESHPTARRAAAIEPLIRDPAAAVDKVVAELGHVWDALVKPFWGRVDDVIAGDLAHRARQVTGDGLGHVLADLHPDVTVTPEGIRVKGADPAELTVGDDGLALLPSAFVWPHAFTVAGGAWPTTLVYPARGIGRLWAAHEGGGEGLAAVLGTTRAALLADLADPATTTVLARRHGLSAASTSAQLRRLLSAGLVSATRTGKEVHYVRTAAATTLIAAAAG